MCPVEFPPPESADEYGIVAVGGELSAETLLAAYRRGIFPWPLPDIDPIVWFSPPKRALLYVADFHLSRTTQKSLRRMHFEIRVDTEFEAVVRGCAASRPGHEDTWITEEIILAYRELHKIGYAHSIESFSNGALVGGLYGVSIGAMFCGESMFYRVPDASRACLAHLVAMLRRQNVAWIDCQVMNSTFRAFGAKEVPREKFLKMLAEAVAKPVTLFSPG